MSNPFVSIVATVIGPDRTGLVELLSGAVSRHGGNWAESRLAHLSGQFAGILRIELPEANLAGLESDLEALSAEGLEVTLTRGSAAAAAESSRGWILSLVGQDRPGIIAEVSRVLAGFGVNVEELNTQCESAAMSGETLFRATARLSGAVDLGQVREGLERIGPDLMVELAEDGA